MTTSFGQLMRTASHLRPAQIAWRFVHEARVRFNGVRPAQRNWFASEGRFAVASPVEPRSMGTGRLREVANLWRSGQVEYLALRGNRQDWKGAGQPRLWRYERHYHAELVALALIAAADADGALLEEAKQLIASWVEACPQPRGDAWEPYPVARRILNWSLAGYLAPQLGLSLAAGLAAQVRFLSRHLEHHLLGNHLICDAAALVTGSAAIDAAGLADVGRVAARLAACILEGGKSPTTRTWDLRPGSYRRSPPPVNWPVCGNGVPKVTR